MRARTLTLRKVGVLNVNCTASLYSDFCEASLEVTAAEFFRVWLMASAVADLGLELRVCHVKTSTYNSVFGII